MLIRSAQRLVQSCLLACDDHWLVLESAVVSGVHHHYSNWDKGLFYFDSEAEFMLRQNYCSYSRADELGTEKTCSRRRCSCPSAAHRRRFGDDSDWVCLSSESVEIKMVTLRTHFLSHCHRYYSESSYWLFPCWLGFKLSKYSNFWLWSCCQGLDSVSWSFREWYPWESCCCLTALTLKTLFFCW